MKVKKVKRVKPTLGDRYRGVPGLVKDQDGRGK